MNSDPGQLPKTALQAILAIKLDDIEAIDLPIDERLRSTCKDCHDHLFSYPRNPPRQAVRLVPCDHLFHRDCIETHARSTFFNKCPMCYSDIIPEALDYDFTTEWTVEKIKHARAFFRDPNVLSSHSRVQRSGSSADFAHDLENAKEYAENQIAQNHMAERPDVVRDEQRVAGEEVDESDEEDLVVERPGSMLLVAGARADGSDAEEAGRDGEGDGESVQ